MYIIRKFDLIGGKIDFQYVSSIEHSPRGLLIGYDAKKKYAKKLTPNEQRQIEKYFKIGDISYQLVESI